MTALTRRQQSIYEYILDHEDAWTQPPTLDDLCTQLGLQSRGSLHKHVRALISANLLEPMHGKHRGIRLKRADREKTPGLPFLGKVAAGHPFQPFEIPETLDVPEFLRSKGNCYVLQIKGDSMIEDGILDGDLVIIEQRDHARNNDIVVALVEGQETTLKRIQQRPGKVILYPANPNIEPLVYAPDQVQIQGVLVGQMRSYL